MSKVAARGALTETAYRYVRDGIVRGTIPTGTVVAEQAVAAAIGSSRTPVRHALSKLLQEGLLEVGPRRQLTVRGFTPEHLAEIRLLREALEGVSVTLACETITGDELDELHLNLLRQRRAAAEGRDDDFIDLDEEFHLRIAHGARLPLLEGFLRQLREFVRVSRLGRNRPPEILAQVIDEHERILDAIEARDPDGAREALVLHVNQSAYELDTPAALRG
jgi:DNA-binding GntR family transcriptional regulator